MNKKGVVKICVSGILVSFLVFLFLLINHFPISSAETLDYEVGDVFRIDLHDRANFNLRITTPSSTYLKEGSNEILMFKLSEFGDYEFNIRCSEKSENFFVHVREKKNLNFSEENYKEKIQEEDLKTLSKCSKDGENLIKIGEPVKWKKNITSEELGFLTLEIPFNSNNVAVRKITDNNEENLSITLEEMEVLSEEGFLEKLWGVISLFSKSEEIDEEKRSFVRFEIDEIFANYELEYETPAPVLTEEKTSRGKKVIIEGPNNIRYENVIASVYLNQNLRIKDSSNLKIYWREENIFVDPFSLEDTTSDGYIDKIEWIVPHLSTQTFEIIIEIKEASHLNSKRNFIQDIYEEVYKLDGIWSPEILEGEYVRVRFEENLTNVNDITIFPKIVSGNPKLEIYEIDSDEKIAEFKDITSEEYNTVYLSELKGEQDSFDLRVVGGVLKFDHIIDPVANPNGTVILRTQNCWRQSQQEDQDTFDLDCFGSYPSSECVSDGDRLACDDNHYETASSSRTTGPQGYLGYGGIMIETYNSDIDNCESIEEVQLCYKFWGAESQHACNIGISSDGGDNWEDISVDCEGSEPESIICINVTDEVDWECSNFFESSGTRARARAQAQKTGGSPGTEDWNFDVLYFNVTYEEPPLGDVAVILNKPSNQKIIGVSEVSFNYTPISSLGDFEECSLWDNSSGNFQQEMLNSTNVLNNQSNIFENNYSEGTYIWNIQCCVEEECVFSYLNRTFHVDLAPPSVELISPINNSLIDSDDDLVFLYNASSAQSIEGCSFYIDGEVQQTKTGIQIGETQEFQSYFENGNFTWSIACENIAGNIGWSENRTIEVDIERPIFQNRFYETGDQDFLNNDVATLGLKNVRTGNQNSASFSISSGQTIRMVEAISPYIGHNGAVILEGTNVEFTALFSQTAGRVYITWNLYKLTPTGKELICQSGDEESGGTEASTGTISDTVSDCVTEDVYLKKEDRLILELLGHNDHPAQTRSITHIWDDPEGSYVEFDIQTQGRLRVDLIYPEDNMTLSVNEEFTIGCEVFCDIGNCRNTNIYVEYNGGLGWENIEDSGNLVLKEGETNPQDLGDVGTDSVFTNFTIVGNIESVNDIRCIAISDYDESIGDTLRKITVLSEEQPPLVELVSPDADYWSGSSEITLEYNVTGSSGSLENATLILNGEENMTETEIQEGLNNFTLTLDDGIYNWTVNATNSLGLTGTDEIRGFYIDTQNPTIELHSPQDGEILSTANIEFNFTPQDNLSPELFCNITLNGIVEDSFIANSGEFISRNLTLEVEDYFWNVTCVDNAGNIGVSETRNFTIDIIPPEVFLLTEDGIFLNESEIVLYYNATDENEIEKSELIIDGNFYMNNQTPVISGESNNFTLTLDDGIYNWTVNVTNIFGLYSVPSERIFTIDTEAPVIELNLPSDETISNSSTVNFNFTVTDNLAELLICELKIGEKTYGNIEAQNGTMISREISEITDGTKIWNVTCVDDAGNIGVSENREITILEPPTVFLNTLNNSFFQETDFKLEYTPRDNTGLKECRLYLNGEFEKTNGSEILNDEINSFNISPEEGIYEWHVICEDVIDLETQSETRIFTVDRTEPEIQLHNPEEGILLFESTIEFNFTVTDNLAQELECKINIDGELKDEFNATNNTITSREIFFEFGGDYFWNVTCVDDAGNIGVSETRNFTLSFRPRVELFSPKNNTFHNDTVITLSYYVIDDNNDIANATLMLDGAPYILNQTPVDNDDINNFTINLEEQRSYNWTVLVTDNTGLEGIADEWIFTIDIEAPSIELISPEENETLDWNEITFQFIATDNIDEIISCSVFLDDSPVGDVNATSGEITSVSALRDDGNYEWYVVCNDRAQNINISETRKFIMDAPPRVTLFEPKNMEQLNTSQVELIYLPEDAIDITECSLYFNGELNQTDYEIANQENNSFILEQVEEGWHNWTIECTDAFPDYNTYAPEPFYFAVDFTPPEVFLHSPEDGINTLRTVNFNFSVIDNLAENLTCDLYVNNILNASEINVANGTSVEIILGEYALGENEWNVSCTDQAGNSGWSETWIFNVTLPDFSITSEDINFNVSSPAENDNVNISAIIRNLVNVDVYNVTVSFFKGSPEEEGEQIGENLIIEFFEGSTNETISISWKAVMGTSDIFVVIDPENEIEEVNKENNIANKSITVGSWHFFYGTLSSESTFELENQNGSGIIRWPATNSDEGNIYATNIDSSISWTDLQAIGRNVEGEESLIDFETLDEFLQMINFQDSVSNLYLEEGNVQNLTSYFVFNTEIENVPLTKSIDSSNFMTGILWDTSDDSDGLFGGSDKEDILFVTKMNMQQQGTYGIYDYELRIPANLREYFDEGPRTIVFYTEIL